MMGSCELFNRGPLILLNIIHTGCVEAVVKLTQKKVFMIFFLIFFGGWGRGWVVTLCVNIRRVNMYFPMAVLTSCVVIQ